MTPKVSVLMSVYNEERYLPQAIESILNQTLSDFEFIIVDDASTDQTIQILCTFARQDERIKILKNQKKLGLTRSLNKGLTLTRGKYIARMDADDISLPERFSKQVKFLECHPEIGVLGAAYRAVDEKGNLGSVRYFPTAPLVLEWHFCFENPIPHPLVMVRTEEMKNVEGYDIRWTVAQDYDLWCRLTQCTQFSNLYEILGYKREKKTSITSEQGKLQRINALKICQSMVSKLLSREVSIEEVELLWERKYQNPSEAYLVVQLLYDLRLALIENKIWTDIDIKKLDIEVVHRTFMYIRPFLYSPSAIGGMWKIMRLDPKFLFGRLRRKIKGYLQIT